MTTPALHQDFTEIELKAAQALERSLLVPPTQRVFGGEQPAPNALVSGSVKLRLGTRPLVRSLREIYKEESVAPPGLELYDAYDIWLITLGVGIIPGTWREVDSFEVEIRFPEHSGVTVISVLPETRFIKRGEFGIGCDVEIGANGSASLPPATVAGIEELPFSAAGSFKAEASAKVAGRLSFSVISTSITSMGAGGDDCQWVIRKEDRPLAGDQLLSLTLLTDRWTDLLRFEARLSAVVSVFDFLPARLRTDWIPYEVRPQLRRPT